MAFCSSPLPSFIRWHDGYSSHILFLISMPILDACSCLAPWFSFFDHAPWLDLLLFCAYAHDSHWNGRFQETPCALCLFLRGLAKQRMVDFGISSSRQHQPASWYSTEIDVPSYMVLMVSQPEQQESDSSLSAFTWIRLFFFFLSSLLPFFRPFLFSAHDWFSQKQKGRLTSSFDVFAMIFSSFLFL